MQVRLWILCYATAEHVPTGSPKAQLNISATGLLHLHVHTKTKTKLKCAADLSSEPSRRDFFASRSRVACRVAPPHRFRVFVKSRTARSTKTHLLTDCRPS